MSPAALSGHVPDPTLITFYAENQRSLFSRLSPWTKGGLLCCIVILVTISSNLLLLCSLYALVLILYLSAGLPGRKLAAWYLFPVLFVVSLVGLLIFSEPGIPVFSWTFGSFALTISDRGALLLVTLLVKALITVTYSLLFLMTTRYRYIAGIISRIFPAPLDEICLMAYRFLFLTLGMAASLLKSVRSRGGGFIRSIRMQGRLFAAVFALVFIRSFERGERVHKAMVSRGFSGSYPLSGEVPRPVISEYLLLAAAVLLTVMTALLSPVRWW